MRAKGAQLLVVLMDFALTPLDCLLHYESAMTTQLARSTPTAVKKVVHLDKAFLTKKNSIVLLLTYLSIIAEVGGTLELSSSIQLSATS